MKREGRKTGFEIQTERELTFLHHSLQDVHVIFLSHSAERGQLGLGNELQQLERETERERQREPERERDRERQKTDINISRPTVRLTDSLCSSITYCLLCFSVSASQIARAWSKAVHYGPWSKAVRYKGNRVPFGTQAVLP